MHASTMASAAAMLGLTIVRLPPWIRDRASIRARPARLDGARPSLDLARDELRQIIRRPALRRRDGHPDALEALAHRRRFHRLVYRLGEAPHDLIRRSLREGERRPAAAIEPGKAQLLRSGKMLQARRAVEPERGDRFHREIGR